MLKTQSRNPFGSPEPEVFETVLDTGIKVFLHKQVRHLFSEGDRVVVHAPGHFHHGKSGKVLAAPSDTRIRVLTDDGQELTAAYDDLIPHALAPAAESVKALRRALDSGIVSDHDRVRIETCLEKARTGRSAMNPFWLGETYSDDPFSELRIYAEKYALVETVLVDTDGFTLSKALDLVAKQSSGNFKVGDMVRELGSGKKGKITRIDVTHADIDYGNGATGMCLLGYFVPAT